MYKNFFKIIFVLLYIIFILCKKVQSFGKDDSPRIKYGDIADIKEFPCITCLVIKQFAFIFVRTSMCTGCLISGKLILTAAHCLERNWFYGRPRYILVSACDNARLKHKHHMSPTRQERDMVRFSIHPKFNYEKLQYDVGIVEVDKPFDQTDICYSMKVTSKESDEKLICKTAGFGTDENDRPHTLLQKTNIRFVSATNCAQSFKSGHFQSETQICTNSVNNLSGTCSGDSGGPLICNDTIYGITSAHVIKGESFINKCKDSFLYVFTRLSNPDISDWINENLQRGYLSKGHKNVVFLNYKFLLLLMVFEFLIALQ